MSWNEDAGTLYCDVAGSVEHRLQQAGGRRQHVVDVVSRRESADDGEADNSEASDLLDVPAWRWYMSRLSALSTRRKYDLLGLGTVEFDIVNSSPNFNVFDVQCNELELVAGTTRNISSSYSKTKTLLSTYRYSVKVCTYDAGPAN